MSDTDYDHLTTRDLSEGLTSLNQRSPSGSTISLDSIGVGSIHSSDLSWSLPRQLSWSPPDPLRRSIREAAGLSTEYQEAEILRTEGGLEAQEQGEEQQDTGDSNIEIKLQLDLRIALPQDLGELPTVDVDAHIERTRAAPRQDKDSRDVEQEEAPEGEDDVNESRAEKVIRTQVKAQLLTAAMGFLAGIAAAVLLQRYGGAVAMLGRRILTWWNE